MAIADALARKTLSNDEITFVTSKREVEDEIFSSLPYLRVNLSAAHLSRKNPVLFVVAVVRLGLATLKFRGYLKDLAPRVVVVFGGYISIVAALAARSCWIPVVVIETNSVMGRANRLAARFAELVFASFGAGGAPSSGAGSGVPLRNSVTEFAASSDDRASLIRALGHDPESVDKLVTIFGGSLGSRRINEATVSFLEKQALGGVGSGALYYVVLGRRDEGLFQDRLARLASSGKIQIAYRGYDARLYAYVAVSDAVICRAGSNTIAELDYFGTPAVLVPLPNSPGDHQALNARWLESRGQGVVVGDDECNADVLAAALIALQKSARSFAERSGVGSQPRPRSDAASDIGVSLAEHYFD